MRSKKRKVSENSESEEEEVSEEFDVLLTVDDAIRHRGVHTHELAELKPAGKRFMHGGLYYREKDVQELLQRFKDDKEYREQLKKDHQQNLKQRQAVKKKVKVDAARAVVGEFKKKADEMLDFTVKLGSTKLPLEVLEKIVENYVDSFEPEGIRGVAITLKGLINIAKTCPDFLVAAQKGMRYFAQKLPPMPAEGDWDLFFCDPYSKSIKVSDLKAMLKKCSQLVSGSKDGRPISL